MLPRAILRRLGKVTMTTRTDPGAPEEAPAAGLWTMDVEETPVELGGDAVPTFLIGYQDPGVYDGGQVWKHNVKHRYIHGCLNATGCVLPLAMNEGEDRAKLWILTRALVELSGSWHHDARYGPHGVEPLKTEIAKLTGSGRRDTPMSEYEIEAMTQLLAPCLASPGRVPPVVEWGYDGCLRFREADPFPFFDGWVTASPWYPAYPDEPNEGWPRTDGVWRRGELYSADMQRDLARMGRGALPGIFLLWAPTI
jgi:hypothetical protein